MGKNQPVQPTIVAKKPAILKVDDRLFKDLNGNGKLPFELPRSMEAVERQKEDLPYDSEDPLFEFGFGSSYDGETP